MTKNMKRFLAALLLFFSGAIFGAVGSRVIVHFEMKRIYREGPAGITEKIMKRLSQDLDLSSDQVQQITPIVSEMHENFEALRKENRPKMEAILDDASRKAEPFLSPEQKSKLENLKNSVREHFEHRGRPRGMHKD